MAESTVLRRLHLGALTLRKCSHGNAARIGLLERDQAVWPVDCRLLSTDVLADKNPFPQDARIRFVESTHKYYIDDKEAPISVTSFVHAPFPAFRTREVLMRMSLRTRSEKYAGLTDKQIAKAWQANANEASMLGTCMHAAMECYANTGYLSRDPRITTEARMIKEFFDTEVDQKGLQIYRTEPTVFIDPRYSPGNIMLPGSVDCVFYDPALNEYGIFDWKRSKEIVMTANGRFGYGVAPFDALENTNFYHYSLQLHMYCYILRTYYHINVNPARLYMVIIHPNTPMYRMIAAADVQDLVRDELVPNYAKYVAMANEHKAIEEETHAWRDSED